jgi:hypothetical protein
MIDRQSMEADEDKRRALVWEIERKLAEDRVRPIIFYTRLSTCWQPVQRLAHGRRLARQIIRRLRGKGSHMKIQRDRRVLAACPFLVAMFVAGAAFAQRQGGVLKVYLWDSPASMSIHEESTIAAEGPIMGVFNNLVMYKQDVPQTSLQSIVPDLATDWSWDEDKTRLVFRLRDGVKWHDGRPFTARDVKCTWDLLTGKASEKLRLNPRKDWYRNLDTVTVDGDYAVTFQLKRPQPSLISLLASGWSPVYPCHVSPRDMRSHPIGPARSNSSSSSRTKGSWSPETSITGRRTVPISTASSTRSSRASRPGSLRSSPARST